MSANVYRMHAAHAQAEINVTPLIDVLLALVVILMIAAPLTMKKLALPLQGQSTAVGEPRIARLAILATGELFLDGSAVNRVELAAILERWADAAEPPVLAIHADRDTRYDQVAATLDIARHSGLAGIRVEGLGR